MSPAPAAQSLKLETKPDFSGTWLLDTRKSNSPGLTSESDLPITISHHDPEFRVTLESESNGQIVKREFVYFTDGRGETNEATSILTTRPSAAKPEDLRNQVNKSKSKWSCKKIVTRSPLRSNIAGHFVEFEQVDEWKLSDDGKVLTQTSRVNFLNSDAAFVPARTTDKKRVYNRVTS
ncbi:MAG TPA: hypothetical protein VF074_09125 [Pyrinomonadaceae bacterium]